MKSFGLMLRYFYNKLAIKSLYSKLLLMPSILGCSSCKRLAAK